MTDEPTKKKRRITDHAGSADEIRTDGADSSATGELGINRPSIEELEAEIRAGNEDTQAKELAFARRALEMLPSLSSEQVRALRKRIREGYYANPEVTRVLAQRLAELFSETGTDSEDSAS